MSVTADLRARFSVNLAELTANADLRHVAIAVSGGSDSMALLDLARHWAAAQEIKVSAVTVDHGLRDVQAEIAGVARYCDQHRIPHSVLEWRGWDGVGNLQNAARDARRSLISAWADALGVLYTLYGHTADDQAETVLMRLARGSGVDGLAGITSFDRTRGLVRPLLAERRADLRTYLEVQQITWFDDPSNADKRFDRVKAREMMAQLEGLGLTTDRLLTTAQHMRRARFSLQTQAALFAREHVTTQMGDLIFDHAALDLADGDTPARVLAAAFQWIGNTPYRPRFEALCNTINAVRQGETRTLGGVLVLPQAQGARLTREAAATPEMVLQDWIEDSVIWDGRWQISGPRSEKKSPITIRALGDAISDTDWRKCGLPRASLLASPAIFSNDALIAAPAIDNSQGWPARIVADFISSVLSH